ncbi:hypothetical protein COU36_02415, partial [Candidatus Micrarchaeota archaeon CG10_big_fil_rev_8_21_14_0_10_59_7]
MLACSRVFLAFACFSFVSALGVSHQALISMDYEPGFNESYGYAAINSADNDEVAFARYVCGPLSPYVGLNLEVGEIVFVERDCNAIASGVTSVANPHILPGGGIKYFTYTVALPQTIPTELKPGINQAFLGFMQVIAGTGGVGGRVAVQIPITVYVPYPGKYLEVFLSADSAKRGEPVEFKMRAENKGTENVSATAIIRISDSTGKELKKLEAGSAQVATKNSATLSASLDTSDMEIASYTAKAVVEYGGSAPATSEAKFKIGELSIRINNVGIENAYAGKTAKAYVEVESMWGDPISGVYAEINVTKGAYSALLEKTFPQTVGA